MNLRADPFRCKRDSANQALAVFASFLLIAIGVVPLRDQALAAQVIEPDAIGTGSIALELVASELDRPTAITHAGDNSGRLFITLQPGRIVIYDGTRILPTPFLDITSLVLTGGEQGLLSVAFHPDYANNGFFYVNYTTQPFGHTVIARYTVSDDPDVADPGSAFVLLRIPQPFDNHNGGQLQFGPDGYLYIGMGDGGGDPDNRAQDLGDLLGKMLRIDVDGGLPYAIPPDNPFVGVPGAREEIWALGLRNPWRFSFDRVTGDLFIADVGLDRREEVDVQRAASPGGENYGWPLMEGSLCFDPPFACNDGTLVLPVIEHKHDHTDPESVCAIIGGYRYRGAQFPELTGIYFYGDSCAGRIWGATENVDGVWVTAELLDVPFGFSTFGEDELGEIYAADLGGGKIYRIVPAIFPDIKANGSAGPLFVSPGQPVTISVSLDPSTRAGQLADWWIGGVSASGPFLIFAGTLPLVRLPDVTLVEAPLPPGVYLFFFILDAQPDGRVGVTWADQVLVVVPDL